MSEINRNEIAKGYKNFLLWLMIASTAINVLAIFAPVFTLWGYSERGIHLVLRLFDTQGSAFLLGKNATFWCLVLGGMALTLLVFSLIGGIMCVKRMYKNRFDKEQTQVYQGIFKNHFIDITIYMSISVFLCFVRLNNYSLDGVKTMTFIPWMFQLAVFIVSKYLFNHMERAFAGEIEPLRISFGGNTPQSYSKSDSQDAPRNEEMDKVELLAKYKELLDNGVITEEEYNEKKKNLL